MSHTLVQQIETYNAAVREVDYRLTHPAYLAVDHYRAWRASFVTTRQQLIDKLWEG